MPDAPASRTLRHVVVAGASGLIGGALVGSLRADGVRVTTLVRRASTRPDEAEWLTGADPLDPELLAGADAVVGLNGANIGRFPWTAAYKHELVWSRIAPTQAIARAVRALGTDAPAFVSASTVGYYGSAPGERLTETAPRGESFLSDLAGEWEAAALAAGQSTRVALLRTAPVVHSRGVLQSLLLLTKLGLAGPIGRGTQHWPWISLDDEVRAIRHVIGHDIAGPVNLTGPTTATANDLGFAVAVRMNRPFVLRPPVWGMRLVLGADAAEAILTADMDVRPEVLRRTGFAFTHPTVEDAVAAAIPAAA